MRYEVQEWHEVYKTQEIASVLPSSSPCRRPRDGSILATCPRLRVETASTQTGPFKVFRRANALSMNY
eukprot:g29197.t1